MPPDVIHGESNRSLWILNIELIDVLQGHECEEDHSTGSEIIVVVPRARFGTSDSFEHLFAI